MASGTPVLLASGASASVTKRGLWPTPRFRCLGLLALALLNSPTFACGILQIKDGYFWDSATANYFIPRGFAYQTFNPPVGANQSLDQIAYDLTEFKKMYANSARVEMVWNQVETSQGVFDWSNVDFLVAKADELGIRLFVIIGFNYAPSWFPGAWTATNDVGGSSVVVNYEHPAVRSAYSNYVYQAAHRYQNSGTIGAWILGNEYAYFDLWNTNRNFLGFDPISQASFRSYLASIYATNISRLNSNWVTAYTDFNSVVMPTNYPPDRNNPGYFDLIQWRKKSIGDYVAVGATAARQADPNHLLTYSMIGNVFASADELDTCEDAKTIVARCAAAGAPLNFWSVNNYALASTGSDLRSADFGIAKYQAQSGLPVLVSETGHSSTDDLNPEEPQRYGNALPGQVWEALMSGALGVHIFTWNDRDLFAGPFIREKGFGIVNQNRTPKAAVYSNIQAALRRMENLNLELLLSGSTNPPPDIQYFWSKNTDMVWPRVNLESAMLWGALKRLGYQPGIIDDDQFEAGAATNAPALLLCRCWAMDPAHLDRIATNIVKAGIHVHADAEIPGPFNAYHATNLNWVARMNSLFGLNVASAYPGLDTGVTNVVFGTLHFSGLGTLGPFTPGYSEQILTWKIWQGIPINSGTIVTHTGEYGTQPRNPALQIKNLGTAKTAITTFAVGDIENDNQTKTYPLQHKWDFRYQWLGAIYSNYFGIQPPLSLSGTGATYVYPDYRVCKNGSVLVALLNGDTNAASVTVIAPSLLTGKKIENLTSGGVLQTNSTGAVSVNLAGDGYVLLYAYTSLGGLDQSLLNTNLNKLWISGAPPAVWPTGSNYNLTVNYDLHDPGLTVMASFERVLTPNLVYAQTSGATVSGQGTTNVPLLIPDGDPHDAWYVSTPDGGDYVFHAWLVKNGAHVADTYLPVRLLWAVRPLSLPSSVRPGATYPITVEWQELPSYLPSEGAAPLDRARLWQPYLGSLQYYRVVLQLLSAGQVINTQEFLTNIGTDRHTFTITVPTGAAGPFTWTAHLESAPNASIDMVDSFEDRDTGADSAQPTNAPPLFAPWQLATYAENTNAAGQMYFDAGVSMGGSDGIQSVFIVVTNPPTVGAFSGAFLYYTYPQPWALPRDRSQWTNYTFAFDFNETNRLPTVLEMQVKDVRGGLINLTKNYTWDDQGWGSIRGSLDRFEVPSWSGHFDSENVSQLVLNLELLNTNVKYSGFVDNVRFVGLKALNQTVAPLDLWDNFDNRPATNGLGGWAALDPWGTYVFGQGVTELDRGIVLYQGIKGGQAAMMVVTNPAGSRPVSAFGLYLNYSNTWSLPANTNAWSNYVFSYSFREANFRRCLVEMQVKSGTNNFIQFSTTYNPGPDGWCTVRAPLAQFVPPTNGIGRFDPANVQTIALNINMLETNVTYVGFFDDVSFDTPDTIVPTGTSFGWYQSSNDSPPDNTVLRIESIRRVGRQVSLSWLAQTNRSYTLEFQDADLCQYCFLPLLTNLTTTTSGLMSVADTNPPVSFARFYRLRAQPR